MMSCIFVETKEIMKTIKFSLILCMGLLLAACGGSETADASSNEETSATEETQAPNMDNMEVMDLNEYDIPATIGLPHDGGGTPELTLTDFGSLIITMGDQFGIEIIPFGLGRDEFKEELKAGLVYEISFVEENEAYFVYEQQIPDSDVAPEVHFFMNKEIDGEVYEIKSLESGSFKRGAINKMLESAETFMAKANA